MKSVNETPNPWTQTTTLSILLVEASSIDAEVLKAVLSANDIRFNLTRVDTRDGFVTALDSQSFDIILSDYWLPSFEGEIALDIAQARCPETPFIFVSRTIGEELVVETLKNGAVDYVLKSRLSRLVPAMRRALADADEQGKRRRAETALLNSEEKYRLLFELNPTPMWVYDLQTLRFLAMKESAIQRYGYTREEFLSMIAGNPRPHEEVSEIVSGSATTRKEPGIPEILRHTATGLYSVPSKVRPDTLTSAGRQGQLSPANNSTEQRMVDEERQWLLARFETERALFQAVLSQMPGGVTIAEAPSGRIILDNDQSRRILGHDQSSVSNTNDYAEDRAFHLDNTPYQPEEWPLSKSVTCGMNIQGEEIDYVRRDGTRVRIVINSAPITDRHGRIIAAVATFYDVTEQRNIEQLFLQSQKMEAVGRLAGGVAHDFNNLLTVILGYCTLLLDEPHGDDAARAALETIKSCGEHAASMTRQLLAFSRKQVHQPRILNVNETVSNTRKMLPRLIGEDIEVIYRIDPQVWSVKADPSELDQVILNLVINARDAMPRGGKLTIETANVVLDANYCRMHQEVTPGNFVLIAVSDTGIGMDEGIMSHIFEPFFTSKETGKGTGLGLATVLGIVKQSQGSIWVYSEPGKGATFKIYLPRTTESARNLPDAQLIQSSLHGRETILIVEDNAMIRALAFEVLSRHGYSVIEAAGLDDALKKSAEHEGPIDLVLADVVMPKSSGPELVEMLVKARPDIKSVYMSGYTNEALSNHIDMQQEFRFLEKPFTTNDLLRIVRQALERN